MIFSILLRNFTSLLFTFLLFPLGWQSSVCFNLSTVNLSILNRNWILTGFIHWLWKWKLCVLVIFQMTIWWTHIRSLAIILVSIIWRLFIKPAFLILVRSHKACRLILSAIPTIHFWLLYFKLIFKALIVAWAHMHTFNRFSIWLHRKLSFVQLLFNKALSTIGHHIKCWYSLMLLACLPPNLRKLFHTQWHKYLSMLLKKGYLTWKTFWHFLALSHANVLGACRTSLFQ